jgi:tRNA(Leu) C34 or U34 (ribose-2'-O)-methylase TrmL
MTMIAPILHYKTTQNTLVFPGGKRPAQMAVEDVVLVIPFSRSVRTTNLRVSVGSILYDEASKVCYFY